MCPEQFDQYNKVVTIFDSFLNEVYLWVNANRDSLDMATKVIRLLANSRIIYNR